MRALLPRSAAVGAFAAALGLFSTASADVGQLDATTPTAVDPALLEPGVTVVYEDIPVAPAAPTGGYAEEEHEEHEEYGEHEEDEDHDEYDEYDDHEEDDDDD